MGLFKTFLATSSVHGLMHTADIDSTQAKVWFVICLICYTQLIVFSIQIINCAMDPENVVTKTDADTLSIDGEYFPI